MKITIISGGSGNDALYKGIKAFYPESDIKVLINAYDAGKSTGVCRKITNTLGVSDIRKNHSRLYSISDRFNQNYYDFLEARYDLVPEHELNSVIEHLERWGLDNDVFIEAATYFFSKPESKNYKYNSFNIANIIYASLFETKGYDWTMDYICSILGIEQNVILNSYDNVYIGANTDHNHYIDDEGIIVDWANANDLITDIVYNNDVHRNLNKKAINRLAKSDLIIISTGTFWSSIYPTFDYADLYKYFNKSNAKKIWVMNNNQDKDSYGVSAGDFAKIMEKRGVDLSDVQIIINNDACDKLKEIDKESYNLHYFSMGNDKGKHNPDEVCNAILKTYIGVHENLIFDFDDTIWSRQYETSTAAYKTSVENVKLVNKLADKFNITIISGNSYSSIKKKLSMIYGSNLDQFKPRIIADANAVLYEGGRKVKTFSNLVIRAIDKEEFSSFIGDIQNIEYNDTCIKLKPIKSDREILAKFINYYFSAKNLKMHANVTGYTTIDITTKNNDKVATLENLNITGETTYVGDEIDNGNDSKIAKACNNFVKVNDVFETNTLLRIINL